MELLQNKQTNKKKKKSNTQTWTKWENKTTAMKKALIHPSQKFWTISPYGQIIEKTLRTQDGLKI